MELKFSLHFNLPVWITEETKLQVYKFSPRKLIFFFEMEEPEICDGYGMMEQAADLIEVYFAALKLCFRRLQPSPQSKANSCASCRRQAAPHDSRKLADPIHHLLLCATWKHLSGEN